MFLCFVLFYDFESDKMKWKINGFVDDYVFRIYFEIIMMYCLDDYVICSFMYCV